MSLVAAPNK